MADDTLPPPKPDPPAGDPGDRESTFELIGRARQGNHEAVELLFTRHLGPLQRWARGRLPQWAREFADTDDLVQDALFHTFKRIEEFEPRRVGALQAYLRQAVVNRVRDEVRRKGRRPHLTELDELELESAARTPLEEAIGREAVEHYQRGLLQLKPEERELIIAKVEMDCTYDELAEMFGKPSPEAARKAAQRALVRLAEEMNSGRE